MKEAIILITGYEGEIKFDWKTLKHAMGKLLISGLLLWIHLRFNESKVPKILSDFIVFLSFTVVAHAYVEIVSTITQFINGKIQFFNQGGEKYD